MTDLIFYTNPQSRGRIAHWMLEELNEPYQIQWLDYGPAGTRSEAYLAVNPMGKIPAITHAGIVVTETPAILAYLAARFPDKGLYPGVGAPGLANYYRWLFFAAGPLEQSITASAMGWEVPTDRKGTVGFGSHGEVLNAIGLALQQGPYVCGEQFTAADVYLASHLHWGMTFGGIPRQPDFESYVARATDRPAYHKANQINEDRLVATA
ncbi:MAG: glutathione S-transferase family protein [Pseudomonadales bacterium]|nr:glutathione S-transferase family protein [Pseudomonadales bacterium]